MSLWRHLVAGVRDLVRKDRVESDLDEELRSYLAASIDAKVRDGMPREQATRAARVEMGSLEATKDDVRDAGWERHLETLWQDVRYAARGLRRAPGFTAVAVVTLALGVGANATIFTIVNGTLLKPPAYPQPDRLVLVWKTFGPDPGDTNIVSAPNFWDWQQQNTVFQTIAIFDSAGKGYNLASERDRRDALQVSGLRVTVDFFRVLGVEPFLGRGFLPEEETLGRHHEVVLSYGLWASRYGADRSLVGRTIRMDGEEYTVVGVMPREFQFQFWSGPRQVWVPAGFTTGDQSRGSNSFVALARLRPGVTLAQAQAELATIQGRIALQYPDDEGDTSARVMPLGEFGLTDVRRLTVALMAAVGFVLLIACVNVANLSLARGATRRRELAIRRALGASRRRVARQLLVESLCLAGLGGAAALAVAVLGSSLLIGILPTYLSSIAFRPLSGIGVDGRVLAFTILVSLGSGLLFGVFPAFRWSRRDVGDGLNEREDSGGGRRGNRLRHALVAGEVALTLTVLCGAGLMIASMARLLAVDPGFDPANVLTMQVSLPQINTYYGPPVHPRFCQDLEDGIGAVTGVTSVGAVAHLPLRGNAGRGFFIEGAPVPPVQETPGAAYTVACPGYFRTMGVPILEGREFTLRDTLGSQPVVVINEAMARRFWPDKDPLGKRIRLGVEGEQPWLTVVGVAGSVRHWGLDSEIRPQFFRPYTQAAWPTMHIVVRTAAAPMSFAGPVARALARIEPDQPVTSVRPMADIVNASVGSRHFAMLLLSAFALLAVVLAAVGIVGVVSYAVTQRAREIGIRTTLGARAGDMVRMFVGRAMRWVAAGLAGGVVVALGSMQLLRALLFDVQAADLAVLGAVAALLATVALVASYVPARRAAAVDPLVALRSE
jgi:putative ABC transport system permease protein